MLDAAGVTVVTATSLETRVARKVLGPLGVRVAGAGISLAGDGNASHGTAAISCGLAGGLRAGLPSGSVLIPTSVTAPDGTEIACDPDLVDALEQAARRLGFEPVTAPLLTSATLVRGAERATWATRGFAGVDMETALLRAPRIAAVRIVLDTPERELSAAWATPLGALFTPRAWAELPWLARDGPRFARRAAEIVAAAFASRG